MKQMERRAVSIELRMEGEEKPVMRGHAAMFDSPSDLLGGCFREIIKPGAFTEALKSSDIRALWNHNPDHILGRSTAGTLRVTENETGLAIEIDPPDTTCSRDLQVSMQRGDVKEMSFAFSIADDGEEWTRDPDESGNWTRTISKIERVYDVSPVTYPAYPSTDIAMRSLDAVRQMVVPINYLRRLRLELEAVS